MSGLAGPTSVHPNLHVVAHPLIEHKLSYLRDGATPLRELQALVQEITTLLTFEATRSLETEEVIIETPLERTTAH
ncbi:MAG TPA: uracil phosphoribosyltransferase, partial [Longimicrobiales bacterium]|nr:uracil phosphoribosyltransferase [Longimicrobiales bacterium]